jgi:UDP-N-acetylmuramoyl-L-alanyl-D-glutamate--2,6-diaminopimelate ligase
MQALQAVRNLVKGERKIYTVFGCGGDRDKTKRPQMGKVADELSDEIIITSDNPRSEDPLLIIEDIRKGVSRETVRIIPDRDEAIKSAINDSEEDAVILIAGKGHEDYQEINGVRNHFSDKEKAEEYLKL